MSGRDIRWNGMVQPISNFLLTHVAESGPVRVQGK